MPNRRLFAFFQLKLFRRHFDMVNIEHTSYIIDSIWSFQNHISHFSFHLMLTLTNLNEIVIRMIYQFGIW